MSEIINLISANCYKEEAATASQIEQMESDLGITFPNDYKEVMLWSNGCSSRIGNVSLRLWRLSELKQLNIDYQLVKYVPQIIGIGSDGGPNCLGLDYRSRSTPNYVLVPVGDVDYESTEVLGATLAEALERLETMESD